MTTDSICNDTVSTLSADFTDTPQKPMPSSSACRKERKEAHRDGSSSSRKGKSVDAEQRRVRKRLVQTRGIDMYAIPEEDGHGPRHHRRHSGFRRTGDHGGSSRSNSRSNSGVSIAIPLLVICACVYITTTNRQEQLGNSGLLGWTGLMTSNNNQQQQQQQPRTLLALSPDHVNDYPFTNFHDVDEDTPSSQQKVIGFYWQVPRCGGTTLKHILGTCLGRVQAARTSADYCDMESEELQVCKTTNVDKIGLFVNADPSDHVGIQRCNKLGLVQSGLPDVLVSSRILHAATLFGNDDQHKGRLFTILRDPIERAISTFYYLQNAYWERHYRPELKEMTLLEYAALPDTANNWMTRWLTGKNAEPHLTQEDLSFAKELLRRKFLVMLTDEMESSVQRLLYYMDWHIDEERYEATRQCLASNTAKTQGQNRNKHATPDKGSPEYEALRAINHLDMELYEYAKELFQQQWSVVFRGGPNAHIDGLFVKDSDGDGDVGVGAGVNGTDVLSVASHSSEYAMSRAAAAFLERPPEEATQKSVEATSNLVATAFMMTPNDDGTSNNGGNGGDGVDAEERRGVGMNKASMMSGIDEEPSGTVEKEREVSVDGDKSGSTGSLPVTVVNGPTRSTSNVLPTKTVIVPKSLDSPDGATEKKKKKKQKKKKSDIDGVNSSVEKHGVGSESSTIPTQKVMVPKTIQDLKVDPSNSLSRSYQQPLPLPLPDQSTKPLSLQELQQNFLLQQNQQQQKQQSKDTTTVGSQQQQQQQDRGQEALTLRQQQEQFQKQQVFQQQQKAAVQHFMAKSAHQHR